MPTYFKAFIFLLVATSIVMYFARDPLSAYYSKEEYRDYRNRWWLLTFSLFIAPGIWIFYAVAAVIIFSKKHVEDIDRVATYCFFTFSAPLVGATIPGVMGIESLFELNLHRLLILIVLVPIFKKSLSGGWSVNPADKFVILYVIYVVASTYRGETVTEGTRISAMMFLDWIVPYFVISRTINSVTDFNRILLVLMFALTLLAAESVMEAFKHWELYNQTGHRLIGERIFSFSDERAGLLRARSIFLSPIILGCAMVVLLALLVYLKPFFKKGTAYYCFVVLAASALVVSFSRGPWVGAALFFLAYVLIAYGLGKSLVYVVAASVIGSMALSLTEFGRSILSLLPFFGGTEGVSTFDYRARLFENGMTLIKRNPLFGDPFFLQTPEMEALRQGQGIIDTVNIYLTIALRHGLVGLSLFVMIFFPSMYMIYQRVKASPKEDADLKKVGRMLISVMAGVLLIVATVSNVDFIPIIYLLGASLMTAWLGIFREQERLSTVSSSLIVR